jgi:hypothetical protein
MSIPLIRLVGKHDAADSPTPTRRAQAFRLLATACSLLADDADAEGTPIAVADPMVTAADFAAFGFASKRAFAEALRSQITSSMAGGRRVAARSAVIGYLDTRKAAPIPRAPVVDFDAEYAAMTKGGRR